MATQTSGRPGSGSRVQVDPRLVDTVTQDNKEGLHSSVGERPLPGDTERQDAFNTGETGLGSGKGWSAPRWFRWP